MTDLTKTTKATSNKDEGILGDSDYIRPEFENAIENMEFDKKIREKPVKKGENVKKVFGYYTFDLADILKLNPWNRSIYTIDHICRMYVKANFEQMKKYLSKKRQLPLNIKFLIMIGIGVTIFILFLFFALGVV